MMRGNNTTTIDQREIFPCSQRYWCSDEAVYGEKELILSKSGTQLIWGCESTGFSVLTPIFLIVSVVYVLVKILKPLSIKSTRKLSTYLRGRVRKWTQSHNTSVKTNQTQNKTVTMFPGVVKVGSVLGRLLFYKQDSRGEPHRLCDYTVNSKYCYYISSLFWYVPTECFDNHLNPPFLSGDPTTVTILTLFLS